MLLGFSSNLGLGEEDEDKIFMMRRRNIMRIIVRR